MPDAETSLHANGVLFPLTTNFSKLSKQEICSLAGQWPYQTVKIFWNGEHYTNLVQHDTYLEASNPGKYYAVFADDEVYYMEDKAIAGYLRKLEKNQAKEEAEEEKKKRKAEKRVRQKERKLREQKLEAPHSKPEERVENDLSREIAELGEKDNEAATPFKDGKKRKAKMEVKLYEPGCLDLTFIMPHPGRILKTELFRILKRSLDEEIHVFKGDKYFWSLLPGNEKNGVFNEPGLYTVAFKDQIPLGEFHILDNYVRIMHEMLKFETEKGSLGDENTYPFSSIFVKAAEKNLIELKDSTERVSAV